MNQSGLKFVATRASLPTMYAELEHFACLIINFEGSEVEKKCLHIVSVHLTRFFL